MLLNPLLALRFAASCLLAKELMVRHPTVRFSELRAAESLVAGSRHGSVSGLSSKPEHLRFEDDSIAWLRLLTFRPLAAKCPALMVQQVVYGRRQTCELSKAAIEHVLSWKLPSLQLGFWSKASCDDARRARTRHGGDGDHARRARRQPGVIQQLVLLLVAFCYMHVVPGDEKLERDEEAQVGRHHAWRLMGLSNYTYNWAYNSTYSSPRWP